MMPGVLLLGLKWLGLLLGAALLLRLIIPRRLDRPQCRKCGYDMTGLTNRTCPECGRKHKSEKKLLRKPAKKSHVFLAISLFVLAYAGYAGQKAVTHGRAAAIPATALIMAYPKIKAIDLAYKDAQFQQRYGIAVKTPYPTLGPIADELLQEIRDRASGEGEPMWDWQRRWLLGKTARQGWTSGALRSSLGGWQAMSGAQRDILLEKSFKDSFLVRPITPIGEPVYARVYPPADGGAEFKMTIKPRIPGAQQLELDYSIGSQPFLLPVEVARSSAETGPILFDIKVVDSLTGHVWDYPYQSSAVIRGSIDEVLPAMTSSSLDHWLLRWALPQLSIEYLMRGGEPALEFNLILLSRPGSSRFSPIPQPDPLPNDAIDISLDVEYELLAGEQVLATGRKQFITRRIPQGDLWLPIENRNNFKMDDPQQLWSAIDQGTPMRVRIRSVDPRNTLKAIEAKQRWDGELVLPINQIIAVDYVSEARGVQVTPTDLKDKPLAPGHTDSSQPLRGTNR